MRILVTGGAGYLGSALAPLLLERGHETRILDCMWFGPDALEPLEDRPGCEIIQGDLRRLDGLPALFEGVEAVAHLAGLANVPQCELNPELAQRINVECSARLAACAREAGVRRFLAVSTCGVYGKGVFELLDEKSPTQPTSAYGTTNLRMEEDLRAMARDGFEPVIARPATLFGLSPRMRFDLAVNQMAATAVREGVIHVFGGGRQRRPFLHVADAARALALLLEAEADLVSGEVFNVGGDGLNYTVAELADTVRALFDGVDLDFPRSEPDPRSYNVRFAKIRERLGFEPAVDAPHAVEEIREHLRVTDIDPFADRFFNARQMAVLLGKLAHEGGEPVAARFVPLSPPDIGPDEEEAVVKVLRSGWLTTGAVTREFESAFAQAVGAPAAVAVNSCTSGLHLALVQSGVRPGDEVIMTPLTWASTANTVLNMGAKAVFADVDLNTLDIDPASVEAKITPNTRAIMPVHLGGRPCEMDALRALGERYSLPIIEDAAHALGAAYRDEQVGSCSRSDYCCFSFYPVKNITTIEGGMITVPRAEKAEQLRILAHNGMTSLAWNRYGPHSPASPPQVVAPGYKYNMPNVNAAVGLAQLPKLPRFLEARRRVADFYAAVLGDIDEIEVPDVPDYLTHAWHLMIVKVRLDLLNKTRDELLHDLLNENIEARVHFFGLHLHEYFRETLGYAPDDLPNATAASHSIMSLPLHPGMDDRHVQDVVNALRKVFRLARKRR